MSGPAFYMTGLAAVEDAEPRLIFSTESPALADLIAEHAHGPIVWNVDPSPMPLCVSVGVVEGGVILELLDREGQRFIGHAGRMGYALQGAVRGVVEAVRVIVGEVGLADWLALRFQDALLNGPVPVRAASGNVGWVNYFRANVAPEVDRTLAALGAVRVLP